MTNPADRVLDEVGLDGAEPPPDVDLTIPSIARAYDYVLGGKEHFAIDRQVTGVIIEALPEISDLARSGRDLLRRRPDDLTPTDSPVHTLFAAAMGRKV